MTLKFTSLKKLMDFLRASSTVNCEFSITRLTLMADFPLADVNLASTYDSTVVAEDADWQPPKAKHSSNHTKTNKQ